MKVGDIVEIAPGTQITSSMTAEELFPTMTGIIVEKCWGYVNVQVCYVDPSDVRDSTWAIRDKDLKVIHSSKPSHENNPDSIVSIW
jgi:hypothetical protein